jgi:putative ABC transport system permease protein
VLLVMVITLVVSVMLIGLVFTMAANERRRELGVLRAMGATHSFVLRQLLTEAGILALVGGVVGIAVMTLGVYLFHNFLVDQTGIPFLLPSVPALAGQVLVGLGLALGSVVVAASIPAYRLSRMDPASAMRE